MPFVPLMFYVFRWLPFTKRSHQPGQEVFALNLLQGDPAVPLDALFPFLTGGRFHVAVSERGVLACFECCRNGPILAFLLVHMHGLVRKAIGFSFLSAADVCGLGSNSLRRHNILLHAC